MAEESQPIPVGDKERGASIESGDCSQSSETPWRFASTFGGKDVVVGPRISPVPEHLCDSRGSSNPALLAEYEDSRAIIQKQLESEAQSGIQYRTCSWQKTAGLLFSEYICLAIMSFPWSYAYLGLGLGLMFTMLIATMVLYTSLVLWEFCLRHPEVRDICDIGQALFWGKKWAWWGTAIMFVLNNTFIQGLHVLVGAEYLNTMTKGLDIRVCRTVVFSVIVTMACWVGSLPRTFNMMSKVGTGAAFLTFISVLLATVFAGVQKHPAGYDAAKGEPIFSVLPSSTTTFVMSMAAFLNISYTFIGQITIPSFIAEMEDPRDFPKALWACTIGEIIVFSVVGSVIYAFTGNQYVTSPAFGSLEETYKKVSFSFMIPTIIFLGCLYASVTGRFVFFRLFKDSPHLSEHTKKGWASWGGILLVTWIMAFVISQVIPIFTSLLSVMTSIFDCWFGFIFWGVAYFRMRHADRRAGIKRNIIFDTLSIILNIIIILLGVFFLTVGTYASVQGIMDAFQNGDVTGVFTCKSNAI